MARTWFTGLTLLMVIVLFVASSAGVSASETGCVPARETVPHPALRWDGDVPLRTRAVADTLWIFDADFENLVGDNAGWTSLDLSGTQGQENHWHKDTIRIRNFTHLGDSTWWCGKYDDCWVQPRGYGNDWVQFLSRAFPLSDWSEAGDVVTLEWDQRFAMESEYDYGYVEVSLDQGASWILLASYENVGFAGTPGRPSDWDDPNNGHPMLDLSDCSGSDIHLRFRFESDASYSSQDTGDTYLHPVQDGAWQLDNIEWKVNGVTVWLDDCEAPGDNGWVHEDIPTTGQTGVVYERTWMPKTMLEGCAWRPRGWWMAAVDPVSGRMVDGQCSRLLSPPIDTEGLDLIIAQWDCWLGLPGDAHDQVEVLITTSDAAECVYSDNPVNEAVTVWGAYSGSIGPGWSTTDWDNGDDRWLGIMVEARNELPAPFPEAHESGFLIDRVRVGTPVDLTATDWDYSPWDAFYDTFDAAEAAAHVAPIVIFDDDGIAGAWVVASSDGGATWESCTLSPVGGDAWEVHMPAGVVAPGTEIIYYFEALDGAGNTSMHPRSAPDVHYEFSILPIHGSVSTPGILLVDKSGGYVPGENTQFAYPSEFYFREALDVLGYEYDVFDVRVPGSSSQTHMAGPDTSGMKCYDTQIWFTGDSQSELVGTHDQAYLIAWLGQAFGGAERNLLLTGNRIGECLMAAGGETLDFYSEWLASDFIINTRIDTMPGLRDHPGGYDFLTFDDGLTHLFDDG